MTVEHGIALFLLGNCITVVFLFIAYHYRKTIKRTEILKWKYINTHTKH